MQSYTGWFSSSARPIASKTSGRIGKSLSKARSTIWAPLAACSRGMMLRASFLRSAFPTSASKSSGPKRRSERRARAAADPGSSATHFTATDASTIRLIVIAVLADKCRRVHRRVRAHRPDAVEFRQHLGFRRLDVVPERRARDLVQRNAGGLRLFFQGASHILFDIAHQNVHHRGLLNRCLLDLATRCDITLIAQ